MENCKDPGFLDGASRDVLEGVRTVFEAEMNAVTDNPLVFPDEDLIVSGGNFHGQPLALAMDRLALAVHEWGSMSERRTFKMLSGQRGLPAFLAANPGLNSGYMIPNTRRRAWSPTASSFAPPQVPTTPTAATVKRIT